MMGVLNHLSTLLLLSLLPPAFSHVVERFDPECKKFFLEGTTPNLPGILVGGKVQDQNRYKPICQKYNNFYRFATLYDTTNRIPVFSAYTFSGDTTGRPDEPWMMEPQLENKNDQREVMKVDNKAVTHNFQAADADYLNNGRSLDRGHLFPCSYAPDDDTKVSTFTLTNVVPQDHAFNTGSWNRMERNVITFLMENCKDANDNIEAYVVTGAVPNNNNNQLKNRVNIPDLLWTAFCCYNDTMNEWLAQAHWGRNEKEDKGKKMPSYTLAKLYDELKQHYPGDGGVQLFPERCHPSTNTMNYLQEILNLLTNLPLPHNLVGRIYNSISDIFGRIFG